MPISCKDIYKNFILEDENLLCLSFVCKGRNNSPNCQAFRYKSSEKFRETGFCGTSFLFL